MPKPPANRSSRRARTQPDARVPLREFQRVLHRALLQPLARGRGSRSSAASRGAVKLVRPNDRLTSLDRLEIYHRMYWYRLIDAVYDDCPGLRALLGDRAFDRLVVAYLTQHPSRSFTLRNLCSRLPDFVRRNPSWSKPWHALAFDVARFEWAQTVAFDGPSLPVMSAEDFLRAGPSRLRLGLQPYVTLLALKHPVDDFVLAVRKREALREETSNVSVGNRRVRLPVVRRPRPSPTYVAVHRVDNQLYYKRLEPAAFRVLQAIQAGKTLPQAVAAAGRRADASKVQAWFTVWSGLGWICRRK